MPDIATTPAERFLDRVLSETPAVTAATQAIFDSIEAERTNNARIVTETRLKELIAANDDLHGKLRELDIRRKAVKAAMDRVKALAITVAAGTISEENESFSSQISDAKTIKGMSIRI